MGELWSSQNPDEATVGEFLVEPGRDGEFLAYTLLARALRRADQEGTQEGSQ
jgi:hypothetical protein